MTRKEEVSGNKNRKRGRGGKLELGTVQNQPKAERRDRRLTFLGLLSFLGPCEGGATAAVLDREQPLVLGGIWGGGGGKSLVGGTIQFKLEGPTNKKRRGKRYFKRDSEAEGRGPIGPD